MCLQQCGASVSDVRLINSIDIYNTFCFTDDSANDPSHGGSTDNLLDGNNSTIKDALMGVQVIGPLPEWPDDHIPPFNAHDAMFVEIIEDERFPIEHPSSQSQAWLSKETDWQGAKSAWSSPAQTAKEVTTDWALAFGWIGELVGSPPALLVDKFEEVYLSVPGITSA